MRTVQATATATDQLAEKIKTARLPTRAQQLTALRSKTFDVLVVGGGATGCGVALDAVSRGNCMTVLCVYCVRRYSDGRYSDRRYK